MAKQMSFNDHNESYWRLVQATINIPDKSAQLVFYGYKDAAARQAGKLPVGAKQYTILGETFDQYYRQHLEPGGPNIAAMAYAYAMNKLDMAGPNNTFCSFFDGATDV